MSPPQSLSPAPRTQALICLHAVQAAWAAGRRQPSPLFCAPPLPRHPPPAAPCPPMNALPPPPLDHSKEWHPSHPWPEFSGSRRPSIHPPCTPAATYACTPQPAAAGPHPPTRSAWCIHTRRRAPHWPAHEPDTLPHWPQTRPPPPPFCALVTYRSAATRPPPAAPQEPRPPCRPIFLPSPLRPARLRLSLLDPARPAPPPVSAPRMRCPPPHLLATPHLASCCGGRHCRLSRRRRLPLFPHPQLLHAPISLFPSGDTFQPARFPLPARGGFSYPTHIPPAPPLHHLPSPDSKITFRRLMQTQSFA